MFDDRSDVMFPWFLANHGLGLQHRQERHIAELEFREQHEAVFFFGFFDLMDHGMRSGIKIPNSSQSDSQKFSEILVDCDIMTSIQKSFSVL